MNDPQLTVSDALEAQYRAAQTGAVVFDRAVEGRVRLLGRDRLDLLHRMSTNDMNGLASGEARRTVLTTPIARMVDAPWVLNRGETALMVTGAGRTEAVRRWLAGYIFFRDQVKLEDASAALCQLTVAGPAAGAVAAAWLPAASALAEDRLAEADEVVVWRRRPLTRAGATYTVIAPAGQREALMAQAVAAGAALADPAVYEWLRLAAGEPEAGHELTEDYIPLEANLWDAVSFHKGCYIGQEIIARMESRGKLARRLVGLRLEAPVALGAEVRLVDAATVAGTVTSAGVLPGLGPVALAYLRTGADALEARVRVGETTGQVAALPFD